MTRLTPNRRIRTCSLGRRPLDGWLGSEAVSLSGTRVSMLALPFFVLTTTGSPEKTGLDIFRENYVAEGLPPIPPEARARYHTFVRCTTCGSCDQVCPLTPTADALEWQGPMAVVVSMARAAPHYAECAPALGLAAEEARECPAQKAGGDTGRA